MSVSPDTGLGTDHQPGSWGDDGRSDLQHPYGLAGRSVNAERDSRCRPARPIRSDGCGVIMSNESR